jgi:hypothetical protein
MPVAEQVSNPKRKSEVVSDRAYRLRKEGTEDLLENYWAVALRRSSRLRNKTIPDDFDPPSLTLDRGGEEADSDDESQTAIVQRSFGNLQINGGKDTHLVRRTVLTVQQLRRVMAAKESLFKFEIFVPRSERNTEASPEAPRWRAGWDLKWLHLNEQSSFESDWTWAKV